MKETDGSSTQPFFTTVLSWEKKYTVLSDTHL